MVGMVVGLICSEVSGKCNMVVAGTSPSSASVISLSATASSPQLLKLFVESVVVMFFNSPLRNFDKLWVLHKFGKTLALGIAIG